MRRIRLIIAGEEKRAVRDNEGDAELLTALPCVHRRRKRGASQKLRSTRDKRNSTYLAYFSAYVLPQHVETGRQGHLVTASHSILARQFVKRVPDVIALKQIQSSILIIDGRCSRSGARAKERAIRTGSSSDD